MSNLYTCSINYTVNPPSISSPIEFQTSSIVYDILTDSYIDSGSVWIDLQEIINYNDIDAHFSLKKTEYSNPYLQHYYYGLSETKQYYLPSLYLEFIRLQGISLENKVFSRQVTARNSTFANLQKTEFNSKEPDKFKWFFRATDKDTNQYFYWSSENAKSYYKPLQQKENSKEVIGHLFVTGSKTFLNYGDLFEYQNPLIVGPLTNNITQSTPSFSDGPYVTGSITLAPGENAGLDFPGGTMQTGSGKQIYLQKVHLIDQRRYKVIYHNRGTQVDKNKYTYWRSTQLSNKDTTYNTIEQTRETISYSHEK